MENSDDFLVQVQDELLESVPFVLLDELTRSKKISVADAIFLRKKYSTVYIIAKQSQTIDLSLAKKTRIVSNEVLSERINLEKCKTSEIEINRRIKRLEEERDSAINVLEEFAEKDSSSRFNLAELKKIHFELTDELESLTRENKSMVEPILDRLRQEIAKTGDLQEAADATLLKEDAEKRALLGRLDELEQLLGKKKDTLNELIQTAKQSATQPIRLLKTTENIKTAILHMEENLRLLKQSVARKDEEIRKNQRKRDEAAKLRTHLEDQVDLHHQTLDTREAEIDVLKKKVDVERVKNNDLITQKVALNTRRKEAESSARFREDQLNFLQREYEGKKRLYKKKVAIVDSLRQSIPDLELQLQDAEIALKTLATESEARLKQVNLLKDSYETALQELINQGGLEEATKKELEGAVVDIEDMEAELSRLMAEDRRLVRLIALLSTQRDASIAEATRIVVKDKEARQLIRMKELIILDHTKRCAEIAVRLKEFSGLYEVVKNERNKFSSTILSSSQALAEMREKTRILEKEIEILHSESEAKSEAIQKERNAFMLSVAQRDRLRKEMNTYLAEYRVRQHRIELQIQQIGKENTFLNAIEVEMIQAKAAYEKAVIERNAAGVQLINRNDEICVVQERWRLFQETLKKGEEELLKKEEELRMFRLQADELRRSYRAARARLPEVDLVRSQLHALENELIEERRVVHEYGDKLEDPKNSERWRGLEGDDPGVDLLAEKVTALEKRLDYKRGQLLERDLVLEEVGAVTDKLRKQALSRRKAAGNMADQLCDLKTRIKDMTMKMLAAVSELSMYQATALRLQEEKVIRKREFDDVKFRIEHGEAPSEDATRELVRAERRRMQATEAAARRQAELKLYSAPNDTKKSTAEPRPTAYIPDGMMSVPKPYGASAPFKPSESTGVIRHIRPPQQKLIEI